MYHLGIMGTGIVGLTTAINFSLEGHKVTCVDINKSLVKQLHEGNLSHYPYISMPHFDLHKIRISDNEEDLLNTDLVFVCVGTPSRKDGSVSTLYIERALRSLDDFVYKGYVVLRSTVLPSELDRAGLWEFIDAVNPEFLREKHAFSDFRDPPFVLIGQREHAIGPVALLEELYGFIRAPIIVTGARTALLVKYVMNAFHSVKVEFANEIGDIAEEQGCDGQRVMEILAQDTKLSISSNYLFPGEPFGGMCLPKDLLALLSSNLLWLPLLRGCWDGNEARGD